MEITNNPQRISSAHAQIFPSLRDNPDNVSKIRSWQVGYWDGFVRLKRNFTVFSSTMSDLLISELKYLWNNTDACSIHVAKNAEFTGVDVLVSFNPDPEAVAMAAQLARACEDVFLSLGLDK